jgi:putative transposase
MPRPKQHRVVLDLQQKQRLQELISKGQASARVIRRAHVLLLTAEDKQDKEVAAALHLNAQTVYQLRKRFGAVGVEATLYDKPRPGAVAKLDGKQEALLVALACSMPNDRESWTMQLLADKLVELGVVETISDETVRRTLKKMTSSPGKSNSGASAKSQLTSSGGWRMFWTSTLRRMTLSGRWCASTSCLYSS